MSGRSLQRGVTSVGRCLQRWAWDWLNERARTPGLLLGIAVLIAAPPLHLTVGAVLAANWIVGKVPTVNSMIQAIRIGQFRRWSRPQSYQNPDVAVVERPPETSDRPWKVFGWQRTLTAAAEHNKVLGVLDDWLNERSRVPGFVIDMATVGLGLLMPIPAAVVFAINFGVDRVPFLNSLAMSVANGSLRRFNRPGSFQRPSEIHGLRAPGGLIAPAIAGPQRGLPEPPAPGPTVAPTTAGPALSTRTVEVAAIAHGRAAARCVSAPARSVPTGELSL